MLIRYKDTKLSIENERIDDYFKIIFDGKYSDFSIKKMSKNVYKILLKNGESLIAYSAHDNKHIYVSINSYQYIFDLLSDDIYNLSDIINDDKHEHIKSPMPGSIVKIMVNEGDNINEGEPVIIIEAMKMETKLYASISGKIKNISCKAGEQVDSDVSLIEIEKE